MCGTIGIAIRLNALTRSLFFDVCRVKHEQGKERGRVKRGKNGVGEDAKVEKRMAERCRKRVVGHWIGGGERDAG